MTVPFAAQGLSWVQVLVARCQALAGDVCRETPADLAERIRWLVADIPAHLGIRERIITHSIIGNVLGRTARATGIAGLAEVSAAFVVWAAADPTSDRLVADVRRIAACCAAALEAQVHPAAIPSADPRAVRALEILARRFAEPALTVGDVARETGVSVWHVARLLKDKTGAGFSTHLHRLRIDASCRLLRDTMLSVKEISAAVGYGSSSQLGRHFRRLTGTTPHAYRAAIAA
jgi:AraC-like DNA-binding protein